MNIITATQPVWYFVWCWIQLFDFMPLHKDLNVMRSWLPHILYDVESLRRCQNILTRINVSALLFPVLLLCVCAPVHVSERVRERETEREMNRGMKKKWQGIEVVVKGSVKILIWDKNTPLLIFKVTHSHVHTYTYTHTRSPNGKKNKHPFFVPV